MNDPSTSKKRSLDQSPNEPSKKPREDAENVVSCVFCPASFSTWRRFLSHLLKEPGIQLFACHFCFQCFTTRDSLKRHSCKVKSEEPRDYFDKICYQFVFCEMCGLSVGLWHDKSAENYEALFKNHRTKSIRNLAVYAAQRLPVGSTGKDLELPFVPSFEGLLVNCPTCEVAFENADEIEEHAKLHGKSPEKACPQCKEVFYSEFLYRAHIWKHSSDPTNLIAFAGECSENVEYQSEPPQPVLKKSPAETMCTWCDLCNSYSLTKSFNAEHECAKTFKRILVDGVLVRCSGDDVQEASVEKPTSTTQKLVESVAETFQTQAYLSLKPGPLSEILDIRKEMESGRFLCVDCDTIFSDRTKCVEHILHEHKKHPQLRELSSFAIGAGIKCRICPNKNLCSIAALRNHFLHEHDTFIQEDLTKSEPAKGGAWQCPVCVILYESKEKLKAHLRCTHLHICTGCARCFLSEEFKSQHLKSCSGNVRSDALFFCFTCKQPFHSLPLYYIHLMDNHHSEISFDDKTGQVHPICGLLISTGGKPVAITQTGKLPIAGSNGYPAIAPKILLNRPLPPRPPRPPFDHLAMSAMPSRVIYMNNKPKTVIHRLSDQRGPITFSTTQANFCPLCQTKESYTYKHNLVKHIIGYHLGSSRCPFCRQLFLSKLETAQHVISKCPAIPSDKCKFCFLGIQSEEKMLEHMRLAHGTNLLTCEVCGEQFTWEAKYLLHMESHQNGPGINLLSGETVALEEKPAIPPAPLPKPKQQRFDFCSSCNIKFPTVRKYRDHMLTHQGTTSIGAKVSAATPKQVVLKIPPKPREPEPETTEASDVEEPAVIEEKVKEDEGELVMLSSDEEDGGDSSDSNTPNRTPREQQHHCTVCSDKFQTGLGLREHMKSHEFDAGGTIRESLPAPLGQNVFVCRSCSLAFESETTHQSHMSKHGGHHSCPQCSSLCFTETQLKVHAEAHEGKRVLYGCVECAKAFREEQRLCAHLHTVHGRPLLWFCKACGIANSNKSQILIHVSQCPSSIPAESKVGVIPHMKLHYQPVDPDSYKESLGPKPLPIGECVHRSFLTYNEALLCCPLCGTMVPASKFMLENAELRKAKQLQLELEAPGGKISSVLLTTNPFETPTAPTPARRTPRNYHIATPRPIAPAPLPMASALTPPHSEELGMRLFNGNWICTACDLPFPSKAALKVHQLKHSAKDGYFCLECGTPFKRKTALESHLAESHLEQKIRFKLSCKSCREVYENVDDFRDHFTSSATCFGAHRVPACRLLFHTAEIKDRHAKWHSISGLNCCVLCGSCFSTESVLRTHQLMGHAFKQWAMCRECGLCFGEEKQLQGHFRSKHFELKALQGNCKICSVYVPVNRVDEHLLLNHQVTGYKGKSPVILSEDFTKFTT